jgi:hypothetical protein
MIIKFGSNDNSGRRAERLSRVIGYITAKERYNVNGIIGLWDHKGELTVYIGGSHSGTLIDTVNEVWIEVEQEHIKPMFVYISEPTSIINGRWMPCPPTTADEAYIFDGDNR